jgi:hypothetical protein
MKKKKDDKKEEEQKKIILDKYEPNVKYNDLKAY